MNFPHNPKGPHVNREQAKSPATPNTGILAKLSNLLRATGTSAPSSRRARALLAILALAIAALAVTAAPALAAPLATTAPEVTSVSYTSAEVTGKVTSPGCSGFCAVSYAFQYSKDPVGEGWTPGPGGTVGTEVPGGGGKEPVDNQKVDATIEGLKGGTKYFVRLVAQNGFFIPDPQNPDVVSPEPDPSFTTLAVDPPTIPGTVEASPVFSTSATAKGTVKRPANADPAFDVNCRFEYISDAQYKENVNVNAVPGFTGATPVDCTENPLTKDSVDAEGEQLVTAPLTGLEPSTTYHLRLVAENAAPGVVTKEAPNFTTAPKVAAPTVIKVNDATDLGYRTATLSGEIERPGGTDPALDITSCRFEYVTDVQFTNSEFAEATSVGCDQTAGGPIGSEGPTIVTATLSLQSGVTYHYRLAADNSGGTDTKDAAGTFATTPGGEPIVTLDPDPIVGPTRVRVSGTATRGLAFKDDSKLFVTPAFAEAGTENFSSTGTILIPPGSGPHSFSYDLVGLNPDTEYEFRIEGEEREGEDSLNGVIYVSPKPNPTATTGHLEAPTATIDPVTDFTATTAHFSGTVDPHAPAGPLNALQKEAFATHWEFVCVPDCKNANGNPIEGTVQGEEGSQPVFGDAKRLDPNTHYEVSLVIHSEGGEETVGPEPFKTPLIKPTVKAFPGGSDGKGGYVLQGTVNPNGSEVTDCTFGWGPGAPASGGTKPTDYAFQADCSPNDPGAGAKPITVEAPLTGLNPGSHYQFRLFATNEAGEEMSAILEFTPELAEAEPCANEQQRTENNSLALPECRAYEMVTPAGKEGFGAELDTYDGGARVAYDSEATNIAKSGQAGVIGLASQYVAARSESGWETIPDLNGSSGSLRDAPNYVDSGGFYVLRLAYSSDLLSSVWSLHQKGDPDIGRTPGGFIGFPHLRGPDGTLAPIGTMKVGESGTGGGVTASDDLSHVVNSASPVEWGPGVYEYVGTGNAQPRRVDLDNFGEPVSECVIFGNTNGPVTAENDAISKDGNVIVNHVFGSCGGANPPAGELWARVNGTTSFNISASQCSRTAADPGGVCNGPTEPGGCVEKFDNGVGGIVTPGCRTAEFAAATPDGSRVFFTTTQQLVNGDIDQTNDIYACDLPSGNPAPLPGKDANPCAAFRQVSAGDPAGATVESFNATSEDGSTVLFTAKGVLADNEDALKEKAVPGDHNLYLWRTDASHPDGQTTFVGRLASEDLKEKYTERTRPREKKPQFTPDGRYVVFTTATRLLDTDTDSNRDVYRYDADAGDLTRASINVFGVAGNGAFDAAIAKETEHHPTTTVSDDGTKIVFTTTEALSPADGNGEPDVYLWTPSRVSLISTGSSGFAPRGGDGSVLSPKAVISSSGDDIYFESAQQLTPADGDDLTDVYDARIGGGFSFAPPPICIGEGCQPPPNPQSPNPPSPANQPNGDGNAKPRKPCPKGRVRNKKGKCVKKHKKHHKKKAHKKAGHNRGGSK